MIAIYRILLRIGAVLPFCLLAILCASAQQKKDLVKYEIGDQVENFHFDSVISNVDKRIDLSEYKGKAVILDFWATWCKPCVGSFPKLEAIQEKYKDELKVVLFSSEKESKLREFYRIRPEFTLSTAMLDRDDPIMRHFPHVFLPHYVWLDKNHKLHSITGMDGLNEENVQSLLAGKVSSAYQKDDSEDLMDFRGMVVDSIDVGAMGIRTISIDSNLMAGSQISKYDWRLTNMSRTSRSGNRNGFMEYNNFSVAALYQIAYLGNRRDRLHKELFFVENPDSNLTYPSIDDMAKYKDWEKEHTYSYRVILPPNKQDSALRFTYMKRDLNDYFGLQVDYQTRELDCIVLKSSNPSLLRTTGTKPKLAVTRGDEITVINKPFDQLMYALRLYGVNYRYNLRNPWLPLVDETGITENIDFSAEQLTSLSKLEDALAEKGITMSEEKRKVKVLVLK